MQVVFVDFHLDGHNVPVVPVDFRGRADLLDRAIVRGRRIGGDFVGDPQPIGHFFPAGFLELGGQLVAGNRLNHGINLLAEPGFERLIAALRRFRFRSGGGRLGFRRALGRLA